jgi:hypothetical protein
MSSDDRLYSSGPVPDGAVPEGLAAALAYRSAPHAGPEFEEWLTVAQNVVLSDGGLHHVAHYSNGVFDFEADILRHATVRPLLPPEQTTEQCREEYRRAGRQFAFIMSRLDDRLRPLRSGALIRTVLHADSGTIIGNSVVPGQLLVGIHLEPAAGPEPDQPLAKVDGVRRADQAAARLVRDVRRTLSQGSQNPGGWSTGSAATDPGPVAQVHLTGAPDDPVADLCRSALRLTGPHYLAYYRDGACTVTVDLLEHDRLSRFFTQITVNARRDGYRDIGDDLVEQAAHLARVARPAIGGGLARIVLDVQQGAVYYYRVNRQAYVVGVTLDQDEVASTDDIMAELAISCRQRDNEESLSANG